jgi:flagellar biosynthesis protein FliR
MDEARLEALGGWLLGPEGLGSLGGVALLVLARALGLVFIAPGWGEAAVSVRMRICIAGLLAAVVAPAAQGASASASLPLSGDTIGWAVMMLAEGLIGVVLGLSAALVIAATRQAGELVGLHAGLAPASLLGVDATGDLVGAGDGAGGEATPMGTLYGWIALALFLGLDGPLLLVDALARSYALFPAGLGWGQGDGTPRVTTALAGEVFARTGAALRLAVQVGAPAGVSMLLAGLLLAVITRQGLALPLGGLAWPLRMAVGVGLCAVFAGVMAASVGSAWRAWGLGH